MVGARREDGPSLEVFILSSKDDREDPHPADVTHAATMHWFICRPLTVEVLTSPPLLLRCSFWDICKLSVEEGFPELICFPPRSVQIIIDLKMIQSVHWSHMSYQGRKK